MAGGSSLTATHAPSGSLPFLMISFTRSRVKPSINYILVHEVAYERSAR